MTNAKHTPTPWQLYDDGSPVIIGTGGIEIVEFTRAPLCKANAAYIVKAVNEREELIKALSYYQTAYQSWNDREDGGEESLHYAAKIAAPILAAAEVQ